MAWTIGVTALVFDDVHAQYGPYKALNGVTASIDDGESVAILGRNGAGKSTLARVASGLVPVASGTLLVLGRPVARTAPHVLARMGVVHLPEGVGLFAGLSIEENLALRVGGTSRSARRRRLAAALAGLTADVRARRRTKAGLLSGGQQRLVAVTAALAAEPRLLLCDEPGLGLSPAAGDEVYAALARARDLGCSLVVIESRLDRVESLCSRAIVLDKGVVAYDATSSDAAAILDAVTASRTAR
jgi:branched-chain amino acid transport system ATP-binding protein